ncbi:HERV-H LTR-associating protein 2 isoform X4 [Siphateles boraxobius]|uniref:HERV-H LTR-associating protein 2 isoform X4 n=1 Tax=Siphateles boraxobius TaxID=180520 RepID=UPI00406343EF
MIYCLYTDDEECIHLVFPLVQALKKRAMAAAHSWTCLILVWIIADTTGKTPDIQVTCMFSEDCVLPCVFEAVGDEIIYWFRQNVLIHSYKQGSSLLDQPDQHYNNKTSLFTEVISSGNASVHIKKSSPQDRGKYRCLVTSSRKTSEHFIIVKVEAPIHSVSLETTRLSGFEEVICSTRAVYPAPRVTFFTEPAVLPDALHSFTRKTADKQDLYSVESKIRKLEDLTYICLVQSFYKSQTWRTSLQEKAIRQAESSTQWWIPATVITALAVSAVAAIVTIKCKDGCSKSSQPHEEAEMQPIRVTDANSGAPSEDTCLTEEIANRTA